MIVRQHIPAFVEADRPPDARAATLEELFAIPFVKRWNNYELHQFEMSWTDPPPPLLMARMKNGEFFVVAYLYPEGDEEMLRALPEWKYTDADRRRHAR